MNSKTRMMTTALFSLALPLLSIASDNSPDFDFDTSVGYQYDSNVNVAEIDANTGEADSALLLSAGLGAALPLSNSVSLRLGYDYSQTSYREFSDFDLSIHHGRAELAWRVAGFDTALSADRLAVALGGEAFMNIAQVSPSIARLFGNKFYVRSAYTRSRKDYAASTARNSRNDAVRADAYLLFDGMNRYLSAGFQSDSEDALDAEFDYRAKRLMLAYGHRVELGRMQVGLKARLQAENRDYAGVSEFIGGRRHDRRFRAGLSAAIPFSENVVLKADLEYADNTSNLDTANFDEAIYAVNLAVNF